MPPRMKTRRWLLLLLIVSFVWLVVTRANEVEHLAETLAGGIWQWILAAGLLQVAYFVTQARIFQLCLRLVGVRSRLADLVPVFLGSMFINAVAPSGGTAGLALYVDDAVQRGESGARAAAGTLLGIVGGYAGFGVILVYGLVYLQLQASVRIYEIVAAVALLLFTLLLTGLLGLGALRPQALFSALTRFQNVVNSVASRLGRDAILNGDWAEDMGGEFAAAAGAARQNPRGFVAILAWSVLSYLVNAASLYAVFLAFGQAASVPVVLTAFAIGHLFVIIAPSPQGVGFVETILPVTLGGLGLRSAAATIVVLAYRGLAFWLPMLAGFFMLQRLRSLGGKEQALRERWNVRVVAIFTAMLGLVNVVSATYPALAQDLQPVTQYAPLQLRRGGQVGALVTGLLLFLLASALWRRKRTAWLITIFVLILSAGSLILNSSLFDIRTLLTLALAAWLIHLRAHFHARSDPPSVRQGAAIILGALVFLVAYGSAGIYVLALRAGQAHDFWSVMTTTRSLFALRPADWLAASEGGRFLITSVFALGVLTLLYAIFQLLRPVLIPRPATEAERARARVLVTTYGHDATSRLALIPEVSYYFSSGGSVTAFLLAGRTAVALGDPLGPERDALDTIAGFEEHCRRNDWLPAFYHASESYLGHYESAGFDTMAVGREAIVDVSDFGQDGAEQGALRDVRLLIERGYRAVVSMPPHAPELLDELRLIHDEWLTIMGGDARPSTLSHFDEENVAQSPVMMTRTPQGLISAYATLIMDEAGETLAVDVLRHRPQIRQGTLSFLFLALIQWAEQRHFQHVNLGAGFPGLIDDEVVSGMPRALLAPEGRPQVLADVHEIRARFNPHWRLRYLAYPGAASLPAVWDAVTRSTRDNGWLRLLVRRQLGV